MLINYGSLFFYCLLTYSSSLYYRPHFYLCPPASSISLDPFSKQPLLFPLSPYTFIFITIIASSAHYSTICPLPFHDPRPASIGVSFQSHDAAPRPYERLLVTAIGGTRGRLQTSLPVYFRLHDRMFRLA